MSLTILDPSENVEHLPKKQAVLALGYPGAAALDDSRHALRFLQEWCSDMAGPLFMRIREELGLAYQVGATQFHGHDTGLFAFYMATNPEQIAASAGRRPPQATLFDVPATPELRAELRAAVLAIEPSPYVIAVGSA